MGTQIFQLTRRNELQDLFWFDPVKILFNVFKEYFDVPNLVFKMLWGSLVSLSAAFRETIIQSSWKNSKQDCL